MEENKNITEDKKQEKTNNKLKKLFMSMYFDQENNQPKLCSQNNKEYINWMDKVFVVDRYTYNIAVMHDNDSCVCHNIGMDLMDYNFGHYYKKGKEILDVVQAKWKEWYPQDDDDSIPNKLLAPKRFNWDNDPDWIDPSVMGELTNEQAFHGNEELKKAFYEERERLEKEDNHERHFFDMLQDVFDFREIAIYRIVEVGIEKKLKFHLVEYLLDGLK